MRCCASWMSMLRAIAMRMTVGRSTANMRRSYIGLICDASTVKEAVGCVAGATDGRGACTLDALSFIKSAHPLTARITNGSDARRQRPRLTSAPPNQTLRLGWIHLMRLPQRDLRIHSR